MWTRYDEKFPFLSVFVRAKIDLSIRQSLYEHFLGTLLFVSWTRMKYNSFFGTITFRENEFVCSEKYSAILNILITKWYAAMVEIKENLEKQVKRSLLENH